MRVKTRAALAMAAVVLCALTPTPSRATTVQYWSGSNPRDVATANWIQSHTHDIGNYGVTNYYAGAGSTTHNVYGSGESCNSYHQDGVFSQAPSGTPSTYTGYTPPSQAYTKATPSQRGACQASGTTYGFTVSGTSGFNHWCEFNLSPAQAPCGAHHYTSFGTTPGHPWSVSPHSALNIQITADLAYFQGGNGQTPLGWGYVCPHLRDTVSGDYIELCFQLWHGAAGYPATVPNGNAYCQASQAPSAYSIDQVLSAFTTGSQAYSSWRPGGSSTFTATPGPNGDGVPQTNYSGFISARDLVRVIAKVNSSPPSGGCGHHFSTSAANYDLVGIESGLEGDHITRLGGNITSVNVFSTTDALGEDDCLEPGERLDSLFGLYQASMQGDGNFVVYRNNGLVPVWASNTVGQNGARLCMQADGTLVMYRNGSPVWANFGSNDGQIRERVLLMLDSADLTVYTNGSPNVVDAGHSTRRVPLHSSAGVLSRRESRKVLRRTRRLLQHSQYR